METDLSEQENDLLYWFQTKNMNDIIEIIKSLKGLNVLIDGITETIKYEIKI